MLKKEQRINKTRDLQKVYKNGKAVHTPALVIKFVSGSKMRIAFIVSKKVSKLAVQRNRVKRVLREQIRKNLGATPVGEYMVITKATAAKMTNSELNIDLSKAMKKLALKK